jgi:serpin B
MEELSMASDLPSTRDISPDATDKDVNVLTSGNSEFAFDLYQKLRKTSDGNIFFSPHSISIALAMTYAGARGETEEQMAETLNFTLSQEQLHPAVNLLDLTLASRAKLGERQGEGFKLNIANSLWGQKGHKFLPEFLNLLAENYGAGLRLVDFISAPEDSRITINQWVEDQTEEKIKDLIAPGMIDALTRLVLVNAIYFNAPWAHPFEEEDTEDDYFHTLTGNPIRVPMMSQTDHFRYLIGNGYKAIHLPYNGFELSMTIIVPDEGKFGEIENSFNMELWRAIKDGSSSGLVHLTMPKFTYESQFSLAKTLSEMGMPIAFSGGADFSGMDGKRDLFISAVVHKAFVKVNEAGTEAAAATGIMMALASVPEVPEYVEFKIDRPFIFLIWDHKTGAILFIGRVLTPES